MEFFSILIAHIIYGGSKHIYYFSKNNITQK